MNSLFVISLPRSLSSLIYHASRLALELNEPIWTSDGEIMNNDRFIFYKGPTDDSGIKFTRTEKEPEIFRRLTAFLSEVVIPEGFVYKDVVHPFVVSEWLSLTGLRALKIKRDLTDVCYSMLKMGWHYPAQAAEGGQNIEDSIIEGLTRAMKVIDSVPGEVVDYDDLIRDEDALLEALIRLYPKERINKVRFIDEDFRQETDKIIERRETSLYQSLERKIREKSLEVAGA